MQNNILEALRDWGCDVEGALERLCGDSELYCRCLEMFEDDEGFSQLKERMERKDYNAAFESAHMLKGVAANLGLTPVTESVSALVEVLRAEDYESSEELYKKVDESYIGFRDLMKD